MKYIAIVPLIIYKRLFSPILVSVFGRGCRFNPTCSEYSQEAVKRFGFMKGILMSIKRFLKCHPLSKGYFDPVPNNLS